MTIQEKQDEIIEEFELFSDWMDKYENIIQIGKELPMIEEQYKTEDHLIRGCQSRVWLHAEYKDGVINFTADSDAVITRGLISLVVKVLSGHTPKEIAGADLYFIDSIGLTSHLSPTRSNGLLSMVKQIKAYAIAFQVQEQK
ncbi:cysteine desulfuration protein SufE [Filimonas zeae]|uniref:Fe-S metabolism protein SufE n=1 Tax=Filimonas zeae TaxID=1737353 RepID=A0A917MWD5_9BACT|nr:SufE family protein [Filimonas zeae]MDR6339193.1 cysteine desulfuration protein SufE [Filimonas zeae]GGH64676.1 Fe-S metabolism protein SufE [Filimonas zeae]